MKKQEDLESEKQMQSIINNFLKRSIYEKLTIQILSSTPDTILEQTVIDNLHTKIGPNFSDEYEAITKLSEGRQAIYTTFYLENEILNGGFNQYFYNSTGSFAKLAYKGLFRIGAINLSVLMSEAINIYTKKDQNITKDQTRTIEGFTIYSEANSLTDLDEKFYSLIKVENLSILRINYIRNNLNEFID
ncbi:DMP19 family protein [Xanthocytophaga flava]|uniref:DMP19 family protein n=1 Tax=Xanthocytophaga flava TaxID=3048013 RepID=UPI0028D5BAC2|nr:DUF4375 domain-containing protein [Xanthocytophaga flavus]MDJ1470172.1 DUF4375 domain-containing protein [Xanthocytophaga flavus]